MQSRRSYSRSFSRQQPKNDFSVSSRSKKRTSLLKQTTKRQIKSFSSTTSTPFSSKTLNSNHNQFNSPHLILSPRAFSTNIDPSTQSHQTQLDDDHSPSVHITPRRKVQVYKCIDPMVPYALGYRWMQELLERKTCKENPEIRDVLFVVQHQPVYSLGKRATIENFKFDCQQLLEGSEQSRIGSGNNDINAISRNHFDFDLQRTGRGGEVTYHGPGQLTVYPVLNLNNFKKDLHWYVEQLESTVLHTLSKYDITNAGIDPANPGVWVGDAKVSAIGAQFKKWNTMHGFSLNVSPEVLDGFNRIVPCGINGKQVISIQEIVDKMEREGRSGGERVKVEMSVGGRGKNDQTCKNDQNDQNNQNGATNDNGLGLGLDSALLDKVFPKPVPLQVPKRFTELVRPELVDLSENRAQKLDLDHVADQIIDSFGHVFDVDVVINDFSLIDFYDMTLEHELAKPRVWLREIDNAMD